MWIGFALCGGGYVFEAIFWSIFIDAIFVMVIIAGWTYLTIIDCLVMDVEQKTEAHEV